MGSSKGKREKREGITTVVLLLARRAEIAPER